jgi:hypothetical protein
MCIHIPTFLIGIHVDTNSHTTSYVQVQYSTALHQIESTVPERTASAVHSRQCSTGQHVCTYLYSTVHTVHAVHSHPPTRGSCMPTLSFARTMPMSAGSRSSVMACSHPTDMCVCAVPPISPPSWDEIYHHRHLGLAPILPILSNLQPIDRSPQGGGAGLPVVST